MSEPQKPIEEPAHDILAAEEFALPGPDPTFHQESAHDILAAEEFALPAPDPSLHHGPVVLPDDPTGIAEPHDVLAAEEFAMPAPRPGHSAMLSGPAPGLARLGLAALTGALLALLVVRLLKRR